MTTVEVQVPSADISTPMNAARAWLDQMHFEPSRFTWHETAEGAVVRVKLKVAEEAVAFAEHFFGRLLQPKEKPGRRGPGGGWWSGSGPTREPVCIGRKRRFFVKPPASACRSR